MAQNLLIEIQIQDNQVRAKIDGLQNSFDTLENTIKTAKNALAEMNATSQGTVKGYREQITALEELRDKTAKTNEQYRAQTEEIQKLKDAQNAISGPMKGSVGDLIRQRNALKEQQKATSRTAQEFDKYQKRIVEVQAKIDNLSASSLRNVKVNEDLISNSGLAGATLTEFGRTVSDLPYGIRGVANNLSQLSTLMVTLIAKTNGAARAFKLLGRQLMGPLGIILLFQAALAAVDYFFGSTEKAEQAANKLSNALGKQAAELSTVNKLLSEGFLTAKQNAEIIDLLNKKYKGLNLTLNEFGYLNEKSSKSLQKLTEELVLQAVAQDVLNDALELEKEKQLKLIELRQVKTLGKQMQINIEISELNTQLAELYRTISDPVLKKALEDLFKGADKDADNFNNLLKSITREIQLLKLETDRAKELLQVQFELEDTIKKAKEKADGGEEIIIAAQERARLKIIAINKKYDALDLKNAKKHSKDLEAIEFEKDEFYSLFNKKQDERSKQESITRSIEIADIKRSLSKEILALKQRSKSRKEFEEEKQKLIEKAIRKEISSIETSLKVHRLSIQEQIRLETRLADLKASLIQIDETRSDKILRKAKELMEFMDFGVQALSEQINSEISAEERKTTLINNELKKRLLNEKLTADQKKAINNQIGKNEADLQAKRDKLAEKQFKLQKAISIGQALINTYEMATRAYNAVLSGPEKFLGIKALVLAKIAAGVATAFGLAQVNAIRKQQFVPGSLAGTTNVSGLGGDSGGAAPAQQEPVFNIVGTGTQMQLAETVAQRTGEPIKAYVVSNDVTTAQELDRNIITGSAIG